MADKGSTPFTSTISLLVNSYEGMTDTHWRGPDQKAYYGGVLYLVSTACNR